MTTYVVEYGYCAIVFLVVILVSYCSSRQFPGYPNRLFRTELFCAFLYTAADAVGAYTIPRALEMPFWINNVVNSVYYILQCAFPALLLLYIMAIAGVRKKDTPILPFLPFFAAEAIICTNVFHGLLFRIDPVTGYARGPFFEWAYAVCLFYVLVSFIALNTYRKRLRKRQYATVTVFILLIIGSSFVQYLHPYLLLSGLVIAVSMTMLYLIIQKPGDFLDITSGVFNEAAFMRMIDDLLADKEGFQATVILLNHASRLSRFLGYDSLNLLLRDIGRFLTANFPRSWSFRLSGAARFVVITRDEREHRVVLDRIRDRFQRSWLPREYDLKLFVTLLRMPSSAPIRSADEFLELINDTAMRAWDESEIDLNEEALVLANRRTEVEKALAEAIERDTLEVYFQPVYSVESGKFEQAEALCRCPWQGKMISPAEFIPIAEQNGLILRMDRLVWEKVCDFLRTQKPEGLRTVGVNLSAMEFLRADLPEMLYSITSERDVDPRLIAIEMTESSASGPFAQTKRIMEALRAKGFRMALDDYGTGYSNIAQVVRLPFDIAKIDQSILYIEQEGGERTVLYNTIRMFRELGMTVVAEGARTREEAELLKTLDVDSIQGFYYAKPMPIAEYLRFMAQGDNRAEERREIQE